MSLPLIPIETLQASYETRQENEQRGHREDYDAYPCLLCGRRLTKSAAASSWQVHLVNGGLHLAPVDWEPLTDDDHNGDMNWFPVGSECAKKVPKDYRIR